MIARLSSGNLDLTLRMRALDVHAVRVAKIVGSSSFLPKSQIVSPGP